MSSSTEKRHNSFDPINDVKQFISAHYHSGDLALIALTFVVLYNLLFFDFPPGYGLYSYVQIICLMISFFTQYWKRPEIDKIALFGIISVVFALIFDLVVSLTFIPNPENSTNSYESLPTAIIDVIGLISILMWFRSTKSDKN